MTLRYVRSTDGNDADNGSTWALADALIGSAGMAAGDTLYVSQVHAETQAASATYALAGTLASPSMIICGNDAAEPPTAVATTATATVTGAFTQTISGSGYVYGITFKCGSGTATSTPNINLGFTAAEKQVFESCKFWIEGTSASSAVIAGADASAAVSEVRWINCNVQFSDTGQGVRVNGCNFRWTGGAVVAGSAINTLVPAHTTRSARFIVEGVDLSACASGLNIVNSATSKAIVFTLRNCKLPASWSGGMFSAAPNVGARGEMYNCDAGDTNYRLWIEDYCGSIKSETTIKRTGGASDGTTGLSWRMATSANAEYPTHKLESGDIVIWSDTTGAKTLTVEIVHDSQGAGSGSKFQNDEIWLEVQYLGDGSFTKSTLITDCKADILAAAANQADSSETWTTTGLASPVKQALSASFTTAEKGFIIAKVVMAKASKVCYVCPKATVT